MKIKLNKQIDYFVIVVLSLAFTGLLSFFFKINELNTRLLIFIITTLTLIVFYETICKLDIHDPNEEITFSIN